MSLTLEAAPQTHTQTTTTFEAPATSAEDTVQGARRVVMAQAQEPRTSGIVLALRAVGNWFDQALATNTTHHSQWGTR